MSKLSISAKIRKLPKVAARSVEVLVYYIRVFIGSASSEQELTFFQKIRSSYILSSTRFVPTPRGYFSRPKGRLRVIDEVSGLPNVLWENHTETQLPPPHNASNTPVKTRWNTPSASFILSVSDGYVAPDGLVFDTEAVYRNGKWYYEPPPDSLPTIHVDRLISFIQHWSTNFIHFTFDTLPRLNLAYDLIRNETDIKILVQDSPFIRKVLTKLDLDLDRVIFQKKGHVYSADVVYYPHFYNHGLPQKMGLIPLGSLDKVRAKLRGSCHQRPDQVVYLKRRQGSSRNVYNEEEAIQEVQKRIEKGLSLTVFEPWDDWEKDKEVMKRARVVFGPHGGAWSNVLFCKENTDVIEFIPLVSLKERRLNERPCYFGLSSALNLNYWCIEPENFEFDKLGARMRVPVGELLSVLEQIGVLE